MHMSGVISQVFGSVAKLPESEPQRLCPTTFAHPGTEIKILLALVHEES